MVTDVLAPSQARSVGGDRGETSQCRAPDLSSQALGEASAGCDSRPSAMSPRLPGGAPALSRAAASVQSVDGGPVSPDPPMTHQIHCLAPVRDQPLLSPSRGAKSRGCTPPSTVVPSRHRTTSSPVRDRLLGGNIFRSDDADRPGLQGSSPPSCSGWQDPAAFSPGPALSHHNSEGHVESEAPPTSPSMYHRMMEYINSVFEDARGQQVVQDGPVAPGTGATPSRGGPILLARAQPLQFYMEQANTAHLRALDKKQTSIAYPSGRFAKMYSVLGQEQSGKAVPVNPNLHLAMNTGSREPRVLRDLSEVSRMEGVVDRSRDALNYSYWCLGALHLLAARNLPPHLLDMEEQLFKAVRMALNDSCRDSTYVSANLRAWRREAYISHLRPSFSQAEKAILRRSPIFSPLLFDDANLQEALQSSKRNADMTLHEAALKALSRPRPTPGTPLVDRGSRPPPPSASRHIPAPVRRQPAQPRQGDFKGGSSRPQSSRSSGHSGGRRGKPFRK